MIGLHMLNPITNATSGAGSAAFASDASQSYRSNDGIVRVSAKTAPQIVSSVPRCRNQKNSRAYPLDTINGAAAINSTIVADQQQQQQEYLLHGSGHRGPMQMSVHHQHQLAAGRQSHKTRHAGEQMVLIINDDNKGPPIIGRRLPSKSMSSSSLVSRAGPEVMPTPSSMDAGPVVGRRCHRMLMQQDRQHRAGPQLHQYESMYPEYPNVVEPCIADRRPNKARSKNYVDSYGEQQPLSIVETQVASHHKQRPVKQSKTKTMLHSQQQQVARCHEPRRLHQSLLAPASTAPPSCAAGCPCGGQLQSYPVGCPTDHLQEDVCDDSSCYCYEGGSLAIQTNYEPAPVDYLPIARSSQRQMNHRNEQNLAPSKRPTRAQVTHHHPQYYDGLQPPPVNSSRPPASYRSSSCHEPRRSHGNGPMLISGRNVLPVHPKPIMSIQQQASRTQSGFPADSGSVVVQRPAVGRPIDRSQASGQVVGARQNGGNGLSRGLNTRSPNFGGQDEADHVSQMYESLAAELKAKLGDPKMGPILLPPKDYDTMSRKQGKLTGIELRRSTNPQLVGPTAAINSNRLSATSSKSCSIIQEESHSSSIGGSGRKSTRAATTSGSPVCGDGGSSSRSSGRSQDDHSLQRSRSNSSSGLGSISMGGGSPNSSPSSKSSSSEDMRQTSRLTGHHHLMANNLGEIAVSQLSNGNKLPSMDCHSSKQLQQQQQNRARESVGQAGNRKSLTPDYCGASDSGHSESGPMDNHRADACRSARYSNPSDNSNSFISSVEDRRDGKMTVTTNKLDNCANNNSGSSGHRRLDGPKASNGMQHHNPSVVSEGVLWNGRVEIPLKVNRDKDNGNTYLATKQIIY